MAYNNRNKLLLYHNVLAIVNKHYEEGVTTYAGVWRNFVSPVYPMSYQTFLRIVNYAGLESKIKACGAPPPSARHQLTLF